MDPLFTCHTPASSSTFPFTVKWIPFVTVMLYGNRLFFPSDRCDKYLKTWKPTISREPAPTNYTRVTVGDVGFIRRGRFHLLFSAGSPLGERRRGEDVPTTFEELTVGTPVRDQPRFPSCLCTNTVREVGAGLGAAVSTTLCVLSL